MSVYRDPARRDDVKERVGRKEWKVRCSGRKHAKLGRREEKKTIRRLSNSIIA